MNKLILIAVATLTLLLVGCSLIDTPISDDKMAKYTLMKEIESEVDYTIDTTKYLELMQIVIDRNSYDTTDLSEKLQNTGLIAQSLIDRIVYSVNEFKSINSEIKYDETAEDTHEEEQEDYPLYSYNMELIKYTKSKIEYAQHQYKVFGIDITDMLGLDKSVLSDIETNTTENKSNTTENNTDTTEVLKYVSTSVYKDTLIFKYTDVLGGFQQYTMKLNNGKVVDISEI